MHLLGTGVMCTRSARQKYHIASQPQNPDPDNATHLRGASSAPCHAATQPCSSVCMARTLMFRFQVPLIFIGNGTLGKTAWKSPKALKEYVDGAVFVRFAFFAWFEILPRAHKYGAVRARRYRTRKNTFPSTMVSNVSRTSTSSVTPSPSHPPTPA